MGQVQSILNKNVLLKAACSDLTIQWICYAFAMKFKSEKFYDLAGASTFIYLTWATLAWSKNNTLFARQVIQNTCVTAWAFRLGTYLFSRILKDGEDRRFRKAKEDPRLFFVFWSVQALWVWVTLLPTMILNTKKRDRPLNARDYLGWTLFVLGFITEVIADHQKSRFRSDPTNHGRFISSGLWSLCRHPNYLGEIILWAGLFLPASSVMRGAELMSVVSPLFVTYLLLNVSGIPMLERRADRKWGSLVEYQQYKSRTAKLVPYLW